MKAEMGTWEGGELLFSPLSLIPLPENEIKKKDKRLNGPGTEIKACAHPQSCVPSQR